jgi:hypothetical protein
MKTIQKGLIAGAVAMAFAAPSMAAFTVDLGDKGSISFGGFIKLDARTVSGDLAFTSYYRGAGVAAADTSVTNFSVRESRLTTTYKRGDVTAFVGMDFYGGGGNELVSNSAHPRLRQAFISYKGWKMGQAWTAASNLMAIPEAVDFGGPIVGMIFVRQPQISYTSGNWTFSVENPESYTPGKYAVGGNGTGIVAANSNESTPDFIGAYTTSGDWGTLKVSGIVREVTAADNSKHSAMGIGIGAKVMLGKDDVRFQLNSGEWGRYIGAGQGFETGDFNGDGKYEMDSTTSYTAAYRHVMSGGWRTNIYIGGLEGDESGRSRTHVGANLMATLAPGLTGGIEVGRYTMNDDSMAEGLSSKYLQLMVKFGL